MKMAIKVLISAAALLLALVVSSAAIAAAEGTDEEASAPTREEIKEELERQVSKLDLEPWRSFFDGEELFSGLGFKSIDDMLLRYAESGANAKPEGIWELLKALLLNELAGSRAAIAALTASALVTGLAGIIPQGSMRPALGFALSSVAVLTAAAAFASLCSTASAGIRRTASFAEAALPAMTVMLASVGAASSAGVFRPLMLFLSGSMAAFMEKAVLPLILAAGIVGMIDALTDGGRLSQLKELLLKSAKWLMGLAAVLYFAVCALQGMTVSAVDGVSVRTARYAIDKLLPSTNGLVGGSIDTFMSCALLVKNGVGAASVVIMLAQLIRPLIRIAAGSFVFRISAALARPAAAPGIIKLLENASETSAYLFGTAAVTGTMFILTVLVFTAAGGVSAGLW